MDLYRICTRCVMDISDPWIRFDTKGICNHCYEYDKRAPARLLQGAEGERLLEQIVAKIKKSGEGLDYDCIVGVSGGVDSTYVAYLAHQLGLRPLAVHFDNGWNSELAVSNIAKVLNTLDIDLFTYVVNWEEFKDLQLSFLKASTPDGEIPTDHGIYAVLLQTAVLHKVRFILHGMNFATEGIVVPAWAYGHSDWTYISDVHDQYGKLPIKTFPHYNLLYLAYVMLIRRINFVSLLNYITYDKNKAISVLQDKLTWRSYGGKHHESIYTRFFQCYILPNKFGIDKRRAHFSNLIHSGSGGMTRELALTELAKPPCPPEQLEEDKTYVIKKLGLSENEFEKILGEPVKSFKDYRTNYQLIKSLKYCQQTLRRLGIFYK